MALSGKKYLVMAFVVLVLWNGSAFAAQRAQGRVFSNEDVESAAPAPPAPAEPAESTTPAPAAADQPAAVQPPAAPETETSGPQDEVKKLLALQGALGEAYDVLSAKIQEESDPAVVTRWNAIQNCLANLIREYDGFIAQARVQAEQPPAQQPPPASSQ